jgi:CHAT domain-containing protein
LEGFEALYNNSFVYNATLMQHGEATEAALRDQAPRNQYLHVATHGFFASPRVKSALGGASHRGLQPLWSASADQQREDRLSGYHPGLLSGIAVTGANQSRQALAEKFNKDDGILTAVEVATLSLRRTELVVLSACETGLGATAGGEGVLGLQRAFQVAGAKTTVTSLWKVDDRATQELMIKFYDNLWNKRLSRIEALRQSQIWMLREGSKDEGIVPRANGQPHSDGAPPYFWAAFVLSGEWR